MGPSSSSLSGCCILLLLVPLSTASGGIHALAHLIDAIDVDNNEHMTKDEMQNYLRIHHLQRYRDEEPVVAKLYLEHIHRDIEYLDKDGDGQLLKAELKPETQQTIQFEELDANGDGKLSDEEMLVPMRKDLAHTLIDHDVADILERLDTDSNGQLSHGEVLNNAQMFTAKLLTGKHEEL